MIVLRWSMPTLVLVLVTLVATLPWGVGLVPRHVLPLLPFVVAYVFLTVTDWPVPSPTIFACGLLMDATGDGPLGYWALIYLAGTMIAQQLPRTLTESRLLRLSSLRSRTCRR